MELLAPLKHASLRAADRLEEEICELAGHLAAATCRFLLLVAEFDRLDGWIGHRSCAHWLSWRCGLSPSAAREHVRVAQALQKFAVIRDAFSAGRLSYSKVRAITRVATVRNESELVETALVTTAAQLERIVRAMRHATSDQVRERHQRRNLSWWWDDDGMLVLRARLDPDEGAAALAALRAARSPHPHPGDDAVQPTPHDNPACASAASAIRHAATQVGPPGCGSVSDSALTQNGGPARDPEPLWEAAAMQEAESGVTTEPMRGTPPEQAEEPVRREKPGQGRGPVRGAVPGRRREPGRIGEAGRAGEPGWGAELGRGGDPERSGEPGQETEPGCGGGPGQGGEPGQGSEPRRGGEAVQGDEGEGLQGGEQSARPEGASAEARSGVGRPTIHPQIPLVDAFVAIMTSYLGSAARDAAEPEAFQVVVVTEALGATEAASVQSPVAGTTASASARSWRGDIEWEQAGVGNGRSPSRDSAKAGGAATGRPEHNGGSGPEMSGVPPRSESPAASRPPSSSPAPSTSAAPPEAPYAPDALPQGVTDAGIPLPRDTVLRIACNSAIVRAVVGPDGVPVDVGRKTRKVSAALRRALRIRDAGGCRFPGCTARRRLHAHHVRHWADGGPTSLANLILLCTAHHWAVHEGGHTVSVDKTGRLNFTRPDGRPLPFAPTIGPAGGDLVTRTEGITADTIVPNWDGTRLDLDNAVIALLQPRFTDDPPATGRPAA